MKKKPKRGFRGFLHQIEEFYILLQTVFYDDLFSKTEVENSIEKEFGSILGKKENEFIDVSELSGFKDDGFGVSDRNMGDGVDFDMDFKMEEDFKIEHDFGHGGLNDEMSATTTHKSDKIGKIKLTDLENFKW